MNTFTALAQLGFAVVLQTARDDRADSALAARRPAPAPAGLCAGHAAAYGTPPGASIDQREQLIGGLRQVLRTGRREFFGTAKAPQHADIAQAVFGTSLESFRNRSRKAYSGQQMLEEYVSFYQNL